MFLNQTPPPIIDIQQVINRPAEEQPEPKLYTIVSGDTLTSIADAHSSSVERLWSANPQLDNPDQITPETDLKIPNSEDVLADRPYPANIEVAAVRSTSSDITDSPRSGGYSSSGNLYAKGYCTWYAKEMRPDLPNRMGDAWKWPSSARAAGFSVGSTPRAGAIAQYGNHVSYVTGVNSDGTFNVREMNWVGLGVVSNRTNINPSGYQFIY